jgi:hypothetical protein
VNRWLYIVIMVTELWERLSKSAGSEDTNSVRTPSSMMEVFPVRSAQQRVSIVVEQFTRPRSSEVSEEPGKDRKRGLVQYSARRLQDRVKDVNLESAGARRATEPAV